MNRASRLVPARRFPGRGTWWAAAVAAVTLMARAGPARADLEVHAAKRFEMQNMSVRGDFSQFLYENPTYLAGNEFKQNLRLEVAGTIGDKVSVDVMLDDAIYQDEEKRLRLDVAGRVWNVMLGRVPLNLEGNRFLMAPRTGLGMVVTGKTGRQTIEAFVQRPEGKTHRNFFQGKGDLQEYVLTSAAGLANPLVVVGSERVRLDGRRLVRGEDYEMDYLEGAILLSRHLLPLTERRRLSVEFEEAGVGGSGLRSTLYGARVRHQFGAREDAWASLGFAGEVDRAGAEATPVTSGDETPAPGRIGVWEGAVQVPLARGALLEARGGLSRYDEDTTSEGGDGAAGAYDLKLSLKNRLFEVAAGRSLVEPGFKGVGLDRFQTVGDQRFASRDGAVDFLTARYTPGPALEVRSGYQAGRSNLAGDRDLAAEEVRTGTLEADLTGVLGGDLDLRYLGETARSRAAGQEDFTAGDRDRVTAIRRRRLGAVGLSLSGEAEDAAGDRPGAESYLSGQVEVTGPEAARLRWSAAGGTRRIFEPGGGDPTRAERTARVGLSTRFGERLQVGVDGRHRREDNHDPADTARAPRAETNTGEARVRFTPGDKVEVESQWTSEVRSRVFLDRVTAYQEGLDSTGGVPPPQTAVNENPVVNQASTTSLLYRPSEDLELGLGYRLQRERDSVEKDLLSRDESADARVSYLPAPGWRTSFEAAGGRAFNPGSSVDRATRSRRFEVARALDAGSSVSLERRVEDVDDRAAANLSEFSRKDRLGVARQLGRAFTAKGGVSQGLEVRQGRRDTRGFDLGVDWVNPDSDQRVGLGVEVEDVRPDEARAAEASARKRWFLSAAGKVGKEGFVDVDVGLTSSGADGRGGEGYRALTSNMSFGVEF